MRALVDGVLKVTLLPVGLEGGQEGKLARGERGGASGKGVAPGVGEEVQGAAAAKDHPDGGSPLKRDKTQLKQT